MWRRKFLAGLQTVGLEIEDVSHCGVNTELFRESNQMGKCLSFLDFHHKIPISSSSKLILTLKLIKLRKLELGGTFNILTEL